MPVDSSNSSADVADLIRQLREALMRGDEARAEQLGESVVAHQPDHEQTLAYLSTRARLRGDHARACAWAEQGLARHPGSALLLFNLGAARTAAGALGEAEQALQAVLRVQPDYLFAQLWLGSIQHARGDVAASLRTRVRALAEAERQGVLAQAQGLPTEARRHIDMAIAAVQGARHRALSPVLQAMRERHGATAIRRIEQSVERFLGRVDLQPPHALQQPTFLFVPGLPDLPWFEREAFPFLASLEEATDAIRTELLDVLADETGFEPYVDMPENAPAAPVWRELNRSPRWSAYHLYRHGERVQAHCQRCPRTVAALEALPLLRIPGHGPEALFSVLRPGTHIPPHTGVINGRLTAHLPLVVPPDCGALSVAGQPRPWHEGRCLVFDDSFVHEAWNRSPHTRVVLIFDLWNPHLTAPERDALAAVIAAIGQFNERLGAHDPMREAGN
jgi:aspartate beta-hydroxylase